MDKINIYLLTLHQILSIYCVQEPRIALDETLGEPGNWAGATMSVAWALGGQTCRVHGGWWDEERPGPQSCEAKAQTHSPSTVGKGGVGPWCLLHPTLAELYHYIFVLYIFLLRTIY